MQVQAIGADFVAEVSGLDLRQPLAPAQLAAVEAAADRYAVLIFRDQDLDDDQQMAFGAALGPLEQETATVDAHKRRLRHAQMNDISNLDEQGWLLAADDRRRMFNLGNRLWHSDSSFKRVPAKYSMLHARAVPPAGGNTEFADMRAAWDALPEAEQDTLRDLVADHSLIYSRAMLGFGEFTPEERQKFAPVPQRLVRRHPGSGRRSLYLSSHIGRIHGGEVPMKVPMEVPEAMALLRDLTEHAT